MARTRAPPILRLRRSAATDSDTVTMESVGYARTRSHVAIARATGGEKWPWNTVPWKVWTTMVCSIANGYWQLDAQL